MSRDRLWDTATTPSATPVRSIYHRFGVALLPNSPLSLSSSLVPSERVRVRERVQLPGSCLSPGRRRCRTYTLLVLVLFFNLWRWAAVGFGRLRVEAVRPAKRGHHGSYHIDTRIVMMRRYRPYAARLAFVRHCTTKAAGG